MSGAARSALPGVLTLIAVVGGWAVWVEVSGVEPYLLPSPAEVVAAGWNTRSALAGHLGVTLLEAVVGFVAGSLVGLGLAVAMTLVEPVRRAVQPLLVLFQSVPPIILAPLFIVWFGFGLFPKILVVALIALFPITIAALDGMRSTDPEVIDLLRGLGAGRLAILRRARIPAAIPETVAGAKVGASYAVFGAVVGEGFGASRGLGVYLNRSQASYQTDQIFAAVVLMGVAGLVLFGLVTLLGRLVTPWTRAAEPG
jgi:ABC-type nitrate/sulfonate/bicarbonate transport system permease component